MILEGGCSPTQRGSAAPFGALLDVLHPLVGTPSPLPADIRERLNTALYGNPVGQSDAASLVDQSRVFRAIREAVAAAARVRLVLLALEDLHWADRSTLDALATLERFLRRPRSLTQLLVLATARPEIGEPFGTFAAELSLSPVAEVVDLAPLPDEAMWEMLHALPNRVPVPEQPDVIRRADRNPFFLEELAAAGGEQLPETVRDIVSLRLRHAAEDARPVLAAAAVAGPRCSHHCVANVTAMPKKSLLDAIRLLADAGVLAGEDDGYVFRHVLLQEVAYERLLPGERAALHRRVADCPGPRCGGGGAARRLRFLRLPVAGVRPKLRRVALRVAAAAAAVLCRG